MTEHPRDVSEQPAGPAETGEQGREPEQSTQRRLVEGIRAFEVDPPPPDRAREQD